MSVVDSIVNNAWAIITAILTGVIAFIIGELLWAHWKKPKFIIECSNRNKGKLGFSVYVRTKEVENATVRCNNNKYPWEKENGEVSDSVDFRIGDSAISFYPFDVTLNFVDSSLPFEPIIGIETNSPIEPTEYMGGVRLIVTETVTKKIVYSMFYAIPTKSRWLIWFSPWNIKQYFTVRVRIVAKGKDEESDYILRVGLNNLIVHPIIDGKPLMEYADWGFEVKHSSKYFYQRKTGNLFY